MFRSGAGRPGKGFRYKGKGASRSQVLFDDSCEHGMARIHLIEDIVFRAG